jgi:transposase-like protein
MHIMARARAFVESLRRVRQRSEDDWRCCPICHTPGANKHGFRSRQPYTLKGRIEVSVQRYLCRACGSSYSEGHPDSAPGRWYARSVQRYAIDQWMHTGSSLRRVAEWVRSVVGKQERWQIWYPTSTPPPEEERCRLSHSTVQRWMDESARRVEGQVEGLYAGVPSSGLLGADGLWVRLRGGVVRVLLMLRDSATGLLWPPLVAVGEEAASAWAALFAQAQRAGLALEELRAVVSDGAQGLLSYLRQELSHVYQQRCIFHIWRNLAGELRRQAAQAAEGLQGEEAGTARRRMRRELTELVHEVLDADRFEAAEEALARLREHPRGAGLWKVLNERFIQLLTHLMPQHQGVGRVTPEWCWRDYRLRLSRGRNHGSTKRQRRAGLLWTIYRNFTPAQMRRERTRHYRHPGKSALQVAGTPPQGCSYLDALEV